MFRFYLLIKCSRGLGLALAIALVSRWVCAAMACAKCAGKSKHNLLKNAKGRLYYFFSLSTSNFSKSKLSAKPFTCPRGKFLFENCLPLFFETQICPGPIATNAGAYCVWLIVKTHLSYVTKIK